MRALLVAMNCPKGEIDANLAAHVDSLRKAARHNCDIAVFPEMSLTGYIDPYKQPDAVLTLGSPAVTELAGSTAEHGVAALFGVVERSGQPKPFITQVFAKGGEVTGAYRKRNIDEDEVEWFVGGGASPVFQVGSQSFGTAVCADIDADLPFDEAAAAGARLIFHCSAPGLYGRRTEDESWRDGYEWWKGERHTKLPVHAKRNRVWIASVGQAGSTFDEDFPGGACLVSPQGEVQELSADWRPAAFVVEIPHS
jgi:predicted amidohydrolase